jgi:hypothetical protein
VFSQDTADVAPERRLNTLSTAVCPPPSKEFFPVVDSKTQETRKDEIILMVIHDYTKYCL